MRVSEVMSRAVATIEASEPAHAAVGRMLAKKIRHLPVVDAQGTLVGIMTDRNLRHFLFSPGVFKKIGSISADAILKPAIVKQVMSSPATSIGADEDLEAAARLMVERRIGSDRPGRVADAGMRSDRRLVPVSRAMSWSWPAPDGA
jgi:acetoin utilization protein AcuB